MKNKSVMVTAIIPAHNEAGRIGSVISTAVSHRLISEVIVVDDGSIDDTAKEAGRFRKAKVIRLARNMGKSNAVLAGLLRAKGDLIILLDADLVGLTPDDLTDLIMPVVRKEADITMGMLQNSARIYRMIGIDFITGERAFDRRLLADEHALSEVRGYGLEVYMNSLIVKNHLRIRIVKLAAGQVVKKGKVGFLRGLMADVKMVLEMRRTIGIFFMISQIVKMRGLIVKKG